MVLEVLINPKKAKGKPGQMLFLGMVYSFVGMVLSYWVFRGHAGIVMVAFAAIASVPFIHGVLETAGTITRDASLLQKHQNVLIVFLLLFMGFVFSYALVFSVLPSQKVGVLFNEQVETIEGIQIGPTGQFIGVLSSVSKIIVNNLRVLLLCVVFSFFYGAGAIFILAWNASVMGAAIGAAIKKGIGQATGSYLSVISTSLLGYFAHGIPEILAYLVGGVAGGIVSVVLMKEGFRGNSLKEAGKDSLNLVGFAIILLFFAALIEVFVSPGLL